jgi:UDP-glucose 4-epimerase
MAATGADNDETCVRANCLGTLNLCNYAYSRGCRKFVIASTIAATGMKDAGFRPLSVPVPDEHPHTGNDSYGFTKFLMEQSLHYCARKYADLDIIAFRIASVMRPVTKISLWKPGPAPQWTIGNITCIYPEDVVSAFDCAVKAENKPGCRIMNLAARRANSSVPVVEMLRSWFGDYCDRLDLSYFNRPGNEYASVFSVEKIKSELGWESGTNPFE